MDTSDCRPRCQMCIMAVRTSILSRSWTVCTPGRVHPVSVHPGPMYTRSCITRTCQYPVMYNLDSQYPVRSVPGQTVPGQSYPVKHVSDQSIPGQTCLRPVNTQSISTQTSIYPVRYNPDQSIPGQIQLRPVNTRPDSARTGQTVPGQARRYPDRPDCTQTGQTVPGQARTDQYLVQINNRPVMDRDCQE